MSVDGISKGGGAWLECDVWFFGSGCWRGKSLLSALNAVLFPWLMGMYYPGRVLIA